MIKEGVLVTHNVIRRSAMQTPPSHRRKFFEDEVQLDLVWDRGSTVTAGIHGCKRDRRVVGIVPGNVVYLNVSELHRSGRLCKRMLRDIR